MMKFKYAAARDGEMFQSEVEAVNEDDARALALAEAADRFRIDGDLSDLDNIKADLDGFAIEDITQPPGDKLMIWIASADCDGGTQGDAFASEREAEDWIINKLNGEASRDGLDAWLADPAREEDGGNFFDYVDAHRRDDLDTFNLDSKELEIPAARYVTEPSDVRIWPTHTAASDVRTWFIYTAVSDDGEPALDENDPAEVVRAGLDLMEDDGGVPWVIPLDANNLRFLHIHSETDEARVYRVHIIRES